MMRDTPSPIDHVSQQEIEYKMKDSHLPLKLRKRRHSLTYTNIKNTNAQHGLDDNKPHNERPEGTENDHPKIADTTKNEERTRNQAKQGNQQGRDDNTSVSKDSMKFETSSQMKRPIKQEVPMSEKTSLQHPQTRPNYEQENVNRRYISQSYNMPPGKKILPPFPYGYYPYPHHPHHPHSRPHPTSPHIPYQQEPMNKQKMIKRELRETTKMEEPPEGSTRSTKYSKHFKKTRLSKSELVNHQKQQQKSMMKLPKKKLNSSSAFIPWAVHKVNSKELDEAEIGIQVYIRGESYTNWIPKRLYTSHKYHMKFTVWNMPESYQRQLLQARVHLIHESNEQEFPANTAIRATNNTSLSPALRYKNIYHEGSMRFQLLLSSYKMPKGDKAMQFHVDLVQVQTGETLFSLRSPPFEVFARKNEIEPLPDSPIPRMVIGNMNRVPFFTSDSPQEKMQDEEKDSSSSSEDASSSEEDDHKHHHHRRTLQIHEHANRPIKKRRTTYGSALKMMREALDLMNPDEIRLARDMVDTKIQKA